MALTSTLFKFDVVVADVDRGVYETVNLRAACHPSETADHLVARVLAYCLELTEGIALGPGLGSAEEPAASVRDLTGQLQTWIDVGTPDTDRIHRAAKASDRVAIYCHKDVRPLIKALEGARIHAPERVVVFALDRDLVATLAERLDRRNEWSITVSEGQLYLEAAQPADPLTAPLVVWRRGPDGRWAEGANR